MHKINIDEIPESGINRSYREGVAIRYLIVEEFGAPHFEMRYFELEKGTSTSRESHEPEHEIFIVRGRGKLFLEGEEHPLRPGDAVLIEPNEEHQLIQEGEGPFGFLCLVSNGVSSSKSKVDLNY
jgi:quercetin dioxygenase-like cupin family protein